MITREKKKLKLIIIYLNSFLFLSIIYFIFSKKIVKTKKAICY